MKLTLAFIVYACQVAQCLAGVVASGTIDFVPSRPDELEAGGVGALVHDKEIEPLVSFKSSGDNSSGTMLVPRASTLPTPGDEQQDAYGPLIIAGNQCFFCPSQEHLKKEGWDLLGDLTTQQMRAYMRVSGRNPLHNRCVFYSRSVDKPPEYLSSAASIWACRYDKFSIWHLWPNKILAGGNAHLKDFYGIEKEGNWLNSIWKLAKRPGETKPPYINYFENMSEAMAQTCTGEVVIMSQTTNKMSQYLDDENIWKNKERPALLNSLARGVVTQFYVVDFYNQEDIWKFDLQTNTRGDKVKITDLESARSLRRGLDERAGDMCSTDGLGDASKDYFNEAYSKL